MHRVSVIIPCYNAGLTIFDCVSSVLKQTISVHEILIYNDASLDDTTNVLNKLQSSDISIKIFNGKNNMGAGFARDFLLKKMTGNIIAFLDSDDLWLPDKLEKQLRLMTEEQADIVTCHYNVSNLLDGRHLYTRRPPERITMTDMIWSNCLPTSMTILKEHLIGARDMVNIRKRQDYAYWLTIFDSNNDLKVCTCPEVLGSYRRHSDSLSNNLISNFYSNYRMYRNALNKNVIFSLCFTFVNTLSKLIQIGRNYS